jgi:hypothetical protein
MHKLTIPLGSTRHVSASEPAAWTSSNPAVAQCNPVGNGRTCAIRGVSRGECEISVAGEGGADVLYVVVGPEVIGYERLKLLGRDIPAAK